MFSKKRGQKLYFSTYIAITITLLVISSTLFTSGILYFNLGKSLTSEFEDKIKAECGETLQVLSGRFNQSHNRLRELCLDNTIRVTLMLGIDQQLQDHLSQKYGLEKEIHFFIAPLNSEKIFKTSNFEISPEKLKNLLASPEDTGKLTRDEQYGYIYSCTHPIFRQKSRIGTGAVIYLLKADKMLLKFVKKNSSGSLLRVEENNAWDLISGEPVPGFKPLKGGTAEHGISYYEIDNKRIAAAGKKDFPGLLYISSLENLTRSKHRVLTLVVCSSVVVLILTIVISFFLSRLLVTPLSQLSRQSLDMAAGRSSGLTESRLSSNVIEIDQLMNALSTMVKSLKKTEELKRYQRLFEEVADPVLIYDFSGNFLEINQIALDQFGFTRDEFKHMGLKDIVPEEHHATISNTIESITRQQSRIFFETELLTKHGKRIYTECHSSKIVFKQQEVVLSVVRDITDRKKTEEALIRSEERLSLALDVSLAGAWELNLKTGDFKIDADQFKFLGHSTVENLTKFQDLLKFIDRSDVQRAKKIFTDFIKGHTPEYKDEFRITTKTGQKHWLHNRARVVKWDHDETPMVIIGTAIDISGLKQTEQALRENEERYRTILNSRNIGYFELDRKGNLTFFNDALCGIMGYPGDEMLGMSYKSYTDEKTAKKIETEYTRIFESGIPLKQLEHAITKKDGTQCIIETSASLIQDPNGVNTGFRGLAIDITDRELAEQEKRKLEEELRQAHKMEAIGTLAGGIAHDFNNILSGILGYSQLTEINIDNPMKIKGYVEQIIKGARRAAGLIQQILTFSRQTEHEKQELEIALVIKEALKLLRSSIPTTIEIRENIRSEAVVMADPTQIHQIVINLCTNAYHAMRSTGGTLTVELNEIEIFNKNSIPGLTIKPGRYLKLEVSDTGCGMDEETLSKAFDPYFTTKKSGEGTGLGLALVYGIVEDHQGYVKVHSVPGEGSTFQIFLPAIAENSCSKNKKTEEQPLTGGSESIMLVDDEMSIMLPTRELLEDYGYQVSTFSDGVEAVKTFEKDPQKFDLIITDMTMPRMSGDELAVRILKLRKNIPVILCTGYSEHISEDKAREMGITKYLQKPVDSKRLLLIIRETLDT